MTAADDSARLKHSLWLHLEQAVARYLMCNAHGRWDGAEKAERHNQMCSFYVAVWLGIEPDAVGKFPRAAHAFQTVRVATRELTDYLDERIDFPLAGTPDYDALAPKFFEQFHHLAVKALGSI